MNKRVKPPYFEHVQREAHSRWDKLVADPDLAAPWLQLFRQIQSPRHVLSELLQNADDAGARHVTARLFNDSLLFYHDGGDFTEEQFRSLCRFGSSNKRRLHTIGFRGIGFKSTFSLGRTVRVITPTLAVEFNARRFSDPNWVDDANDVETTMIIVPLADADREKALLDSMAQWGRSPEALLFFTNVTSLQLQEQTIERRIVGPGPVPRSERVILRGAGADAELLVFHSADEPFPADAIAEIREERGETALDLPPCRVELVLGSPDPGRVFVVLPTDLRLQLPVSLNAPFVQDPARTGLKSTSQSPTNRWLLQRAGHLIADVLKAWLGNEGLDLPGRAAAYALLPELAPTQDGPAAEFDVVVRSALAPDLRGVPIALTSAAALASRAECVAPPLPLYDVWTGNDLLNAIGCQGPALLAAEVTNAARGRLAQWDAIQRISNDDAVAGLSRTSPPRPASWDALAALWRWLERTVTGDYSGQKRKGLKILPVQGASHLFAEPSVVRLPLDATGINGDEWAFVLSMLSPIDPQWLDFLGRDGGALTSERDLLRVLGLERATASDTLALRAYGHLLTRASVETEDLLRLTRLIARLGASVPPNFRYATRDGKLRDVDQGLAFDPEGWLADVLPAGVAEEHLLHGLYNELISGNDAQQIGQWIRAEKSRLEPLPVLERSQTWLQTERALGEFARERGATGTIQLQKKTPSFVVRDWTFRKEVLVHLRQGSKQDQTLWARLVRRMLASPAEFWMERCAAVVRQSTPSGNTFPVGLEEVPAAWLTVLKGQPCLFDTHGTPRLPTDLLVRSPQTEPMHELEPFVDASLDTEANRPLLLSLGARATPSDPGRLIDRIRSLAGQPSGDIIQELARRYGQLDALILRMDARGQQDLVSIFSKEPLILSEDMKWRRSHEIVQDRGEFDVEALTGLHACARNLPLWTRLGVAERPDGDFIVTWLSTMADGRKFDTEESARVRAALRTSPGLIWNRCAHWLSLDGSWVPCDSLKYRLTMQGLVGWAGLFQNVKLATADLRMLPRDVWNRTPFVNLRDIGAELSTGVSDVVAAPHADHAREWIGALAFGLQRIKLENVESTQRIRAVAARLGSTEWIPFRRLSVTPMLDGVQAGVPSSQRVVWSGQHLYVQDGPLAKIISDLVAEVARPFDNDVITEAIKHCAARDGAFVEAYLAEHFLLEEGIAQMPPHHDAPPAAAVPPDVVRPVAIPPVEGDGLPEAGREGDVLTEAGSGPDRKRGTVASRPSVPAIDAYARAEGFELVGDRYLRPDGARLERNGAFGWDGFGLDGSHTGRYWLAPTALAMGVEIPGELWMMLESEPQTFFLVVSDGDGSFRRYSGTQLLVLKTRGDLEVSAAEYRLRLRNHDTAHVPQSADDSPR